MTQEALKLALEALEANDQLINGTGTKGGLVYCMDGYYSDCFDVDPINKQTEEAITAIKEALAQPEQEPVALPCCGYADSSAIKWNSYNQVVQCHNCGQVYTHPPQRTWLGLAAEDRLTAKYMQDAPDGIEAVIDYIESKLKEKNT